MKLHPLEPTRVLIQSLPIDFLRFESDLDTIDDKEQFDRYIANHVVQEFSINLYALPFFNRLHMVYFDLSIPQLRAMKQLFQGNFFHNCLYHHTEMSQALFLGENALGVALNMKKISWEEIEKVMNPIFEQSFDLSVFKDLYIKEWNVLESMFRNHRIPIDLYIQYKEAPELLS